MALDKKLEACVETYRASLGGFDITITINLDSDKKLKSLSLSGLSETNGGIYITSSETGAIQMNINSSQLDMKLIQELSKEVDLLIKQYKKDDESK